MRKLVYILFIILSFAYTSCSEDSMTSVDGGSGKTVSIQLVPQMVSSSKLIDEDNLASEQIVKNVSIFFTEPSSNAVIGKYVNWGFTDLNDYKLVTLSLDPAVIQSKDIYVITNYNNANNLNAVSTLDDLKALMTPVAGEGNNLSPDNGITMYGETLNFNFNDGTNSPAVVNVDRTCAKYRITVEFPENPVLSMNNHFLIANAARYTYVVKNNSSSLPTTAYYTYAASLPLVYNGSAHTANTYVYEATQVPKLYLYTQMSNMSGTQTFSADLPRPWRNYLYDIKVQVYSGNVPAGTKSMNYDVEGHYAYKVSIKAYDEKGREIPYEE